MKYANNFVNDRFSITPSGFFGNSPDMIQSRENFMKPTELNGLYTFASSIKVWDVTETHYNEDGTIIYESEYWKDRVATRDTIISQNLTIVNSIDRIVKRLKKEVRRVLWRTFKQILVTKLKKNMASIVAQERNKQSLRNVV